MKAINPNTGEVIAEYESLSNLQLDEAVSAADEAFPPWRDTSFEARAELMRSVASALRNDQERWAQLMTAEMGKPINEARGEVAKSAWVCDYYADNAQGFLAPNTIETDASSSGVRYDPTGAILAIMPWNFPFWQVFRFAAPTLMSGNVALLKHAPNVPGCALAIQEIFEHAGLPAGVFTNLFVEVDQVPKIIADSRVRGVSLTGSVAAGRAVGRAAGEALTPCVLELGGSDPFIVFEDADLDAAVAAALTSRMLNNGQSCIAAKRLIVVDEVYDSFRSKLAESIQGLRVGDPALDDTDIGPMARIDLVESLHAQVQASIKAGAICTLGGERSTLGPYFYPPTLLEDVTPGMPAFNEELFGPVAVLIRAKSRQHCLELANDTAFGLGASLWTQSTSTDPLIKALDAGCVFINGFVKSDPRLPFGGTKTSGFGRELSRFGILEFVNKKTYWIA